MYDLTLPLTRRTQPLQFCEFSNKYLRGLEYVINQAVSNSNDLVKGAVITNVSGGEVRAPLINTPVGLARQFISTNNEATLLPSWTNVTSEASYLSVFYGERGVAWELGSTANPDHFPFSSGLYTDAFWGSRWASNVALLSGDTWTGKHIVVISVKNGRQTIFHNGRLWHTNTLSSGFTLPTTFTINKSTSNNYYGVLDALWSRALTDAEGISLTKNPWQIFEEDQRILYFNAVTGGGGGVSLSGISSSIYSYNLFNTLNTNVTSLSSSSQIGTLSNTLNTNVTSLSSSSQIGTLSNTLNTNVTSNAITSSVTPLTSSIGKELAGNNIISSLGNVTVFVLGDLTLALFGNSLTAVLDALSVIRSTNATGIDSTTISGSLGSTATTTLSSSLLQAAQNQIESSVSKNLAGSLLNGSLGFLQILDGSIVLPLTGESLFLTQDVLLPLITKEISGTSLVLSLEQITSLKEKLLPGQSTIFSQGSTGLVVSKTATGSIILSGQGSVLFADSNITTALSGSSFTSLQGILSVFGDVEPIITKVVVQGTSYTLITFNTLNKIIT